MLAVANNYEVILITPHNVDWANKVYECIFMGLRSKSLNIVIQIVEFWIEFKQSLIEAIRGHSEENLRPLLQQIDQSVQLCKPFLMACTICLDQCEFPIFVHSSGMAIEAHEDTQEELRGCTVKSFRVFLEEFFLNSYMLINDAYAEEGAKQVIDLIKAKIDKSAQNLAAAESCLFMLKSLEVALNDDESPVSATLVQQVFEIFAALLAEQGPYAEVMRQPTNLVLKKGFCSLVNEMASFLNKFPHLVSPCIRAVLSMQDSINFAQQHQVTEVNCSAMETLYVKSVMEIC